MDLSNYCSKKQFEQIKHIDDEELRSKTLTVLQIKDLRDKHYNDLLKQMSSLLMIEARDQLDKGTHSIKAFQDIYNNLKLKPKANNPGSEFYWAGVSPPETGERYEGLRKRYLKLSKSKQIKWILACFEQRGETKSETGLGFHTHCIINQSGGRSNSNIKQQFGRVFSKAGTQKITPMLNDYLQDKIRYMSGNKDKDPDGKKQKRVDIDTIMRKNMGIKILHLFKNGMQTELDGIPNLKWLKDKNLI